jgi:hypothetical protein
MLFCSDCTLCRYAVKAEPPSDITVDVTAAERLGLRGSKEMLSLISNMVVSRVVQPCEAAAVMGGIPMFKGSTKVVSYTTSPPKWRVRTVVPGAQTVLLAPVDRYCSRPTGVVEGIDFDAMTLYEYFTKFTVQATKRRVPVVAKDLFGNFVQHRSPGEPVRFSIYSPCSQRDGFFYNILLEHVPFRDENSLLSVGNPNKSKRRVPYQ